MELSIGTNPIIHCRDIIFHDFSLRFCFLFFAVLAFHSIGFSQELEPRSLTNLPVGMNFVATGYAFATGNTLMDPALPLDDFNGQIHSTFLAYVRAVNFFGKSGKVDAILPFATGDFHGVYQGGDFEDSFTGLGDLRLRATINLTGAPALKTTDFNNYQQKTVSGFTLQVIFPTGNYNNQQLANLGSNRFAIRTAYGISYSFQKWIVEGFVGVWLFSDNNKFLGDHKLAQSPLLVAKSHLTRSFKKGMWLALDLGYGYGAKSYVDDVQRDAIVSGMRLGLTYSLPLNLKNSLKFVAVSGIRFKQGGDFDAFSIVYQYRWIKETD